MKKVLAIFLFTLLFQLTSYAQHNKPKATYQVGAAKITVWENEREGPHGKFIATSFKVEKIYKKNDEWKSTDNFNLEELLELRAAIDKAINEQGVKVTEEEHE
jgi:3-oxoacyl-ACP reductase-like protein